MKYRRFVRKGSIRSHHGNMTIPGQFDPFEGKHLTDLITTLQRVSNVVIEKSYISSHFAKIVYRNRLFRRVVQRGI